MASRAFVGFAWMSGHLHPDSVPFATSAMFAGSALTILNVALWFKYVSKDWTLIYGIPFVFYALSIFWFLIQDESPKFTYGMGKYDETRRILTNIGRANGSL